MMGMVDAYAQIEIETARQYVAANMQQQQLTPPDIDGLLLSSAYKSPTTGWYHVYFNQAYQSVEVYNRMMNVVLMDKQVSYTNHNFIAGIDRIAKTGTSKSMISPVVALQKAAANVGLASTNLLPIQELATAKLADGTLTKAVYSLTNLSNEKINVKLYWLPVTTFTVEKKQTAINKLALTWQVRFLTKDGKHGWNIHVDATSGEILQKKDAIISCNFGTSTHLAAPHECVDGTQPDGAKYFGIQKKSGAFTGNGYTVFDYPIEGPTFGPRTESVMPYARFAPAGVGPGTTNGWHDDGVTSYTTTRGNNVYAQEDIDDNDQPGASPQSATLDFTYPYTFGLNTAVGNRDAAITNLFYWNNLIHDVLWKFGFDEPSGNFQNSNIQGLGGLGNDYVIADVQDGGGTNNANFFTDNDGIRGRMQMYLWNTSSTYQPDGDFDNGIITHEYGHGWSTRLTGGPANSSCLDNAEQGGEGWSDFLALMLTTNWSSLSANVASANIPRGVGTYSLGQPTNGVGIRDYPYSYDMDNVNGNVTYAKVGDADFAIPHGIGSIWATMLWDMTWEIIMQDNHIEQNIYTTPSSITAMRGNIAALKLVNEGLRMQPCSPSFVQARDAILQADQMLFGGRYHCAIGRAFARRGLGAGASTGVSSNDRLVTESFAPIDGPALSSPITATVCSNTLFTYNATSTTANTTISWVRMPVTGVSNGSAISSSAAINETLINTTTSPVVVRYVFTLSAPSAQCSTQQTIKVTVYPSIVPIVGSYSVCQDASVPTGAGLVVPTQISNLVNGALTTGSPTYARAANDDVTTYNTGTTVYYQSFTFVAPASGPQTFEVTASTFPDNDSYLSLYQTSFNPASPATNFLRGDDDIDFFEGLYLSKLTHTLVAGSTYILVVGTFYSGITGSFTLQATDQGFQLGPPNWFTAPSGGSPVFSGTVFNPVGVGGSGVPNTNTPGTTVFYVASPNQSICRTATTFTVLGTASPVVSSTSVIITSGGSATLNATGCTGVGATLKWYQTADNVAVSMPVSPTVTTQYYARCQQTASSGVCLSVPSQNVTVTVVTPTAFSSAQTGNWNVPTTWDCNCIPNGTLPVQIMSTHVVTVPTAYTGQAKKLKFTGSGKVRLEGTGKVNIVN
ncbi:M36 family metallopeptidase [Spirosoma sp. BT702]|uniref:M36 family metallopeptidase n=2 Tax=Spirosoma profusum TaxID=2771354 RepID=A0A926Y237_9BACT|nr:M36 family metallopeptidase [Spirosoma profusum]